MKRRTKATANIREQTCVVTMRRLLLLTGSSVGETIFQPNLGRKERSNWPSVVVLVESIARSFPGGVGVVVGLAADKACKTASYAASVR